MISNERATIVDDYAHHPTAVRATIAAARQYHPGELVVAFQPHRYTRTAFLAREFAAALRGADRVYLAPVYAASEPAIPGVSERSIGESLAAIGASVSYVACVEDLEDRLLEEAPPGAMVLMLGAGDITDVAARLARRLSDRSRFAAPRCAREPHDRASPAQPARGIGSPSRCARSSASVSASTSRSRVTRRGRSVARPTRLRRYRIETELAQLMRFCLRRRMAWWIIGGGSNVLVGDGGVRGVVIRLAGEFAAAHVRVDDGRVVVDAGGIGRHGAGYGQSGLGGRSRASVRWPAFPARSADRCG